MPFFIFIMFFYIGLNSFAAQLTFEERKAEIAECDASEDKKPLYCAYKHYRFYKDVTHRKLYKGHNEDEVIEHVHLAAKKDHIAANFDYTLQLIGKGDPTAYQNAVKTKNLFENMDKADQVSHDLSYIKGLANWHRSQPEKDINILVELAEILDPQKGPLIDKKEVWKRLQPFTSESNGTTPRNQIYSINSDQKRFSIHKSELYPLFTKAVELKVPEATYHLGRMHLSRSAPESSNLTPKADYEKYESYIEQAKSLNYPPAFMENYRLLSPRRSAGHNYAAKKEISKKWKGPTMIDLRKPLI